MDGDGGDDHEAGVNLVGFVGGELGHGPSVRLGLGEIVRRVARGLEYAGVPFAAVPYRPSSASSEQPTFRAETQAVVRHERHLPERRLPRRLPRATQAPTSSRGRNSIGFWFWETRRFRSTEIRRLAFLDEIWVGELVRPATLSPPRSTFPCLRRAAADGEPAAPPLTRSELGLPEGYLFLYSFNFVSGVRKNPQAVARRLHPRVRARKRALRSSSRASTAGSESRTLLAELERAAAGTSGHVRRRPLRLGRREAGRSWRAATATCRSIGARGSG